MPNGRVRAEKPGFQPTYEGLKPEYLDHLVDVRGGFQPTYEGLKLLIDPDILEAHNCFQPTYKGLKREHILLGTIA